jgi:hypothetical protein
LVVSTGSGRTADLSSNTSVSRTSIGALPLPAQARASAGSTIAVAAL